MQFTILGLFSLALYGSTVAAKGYPGNPCEKTGASCDPVIRDFCSGKQDAKVNLPCGPRGYVGVSCCWHGNKVEV
ncbi:hypothetical protein GQ602_002080 [Ophiocordyceps camponoti-floridani]|uniref:Uncharacterized protein n=1 Tax=Ophiocordyceps camponoti-floridani TaxID=2030778 RepID=A0A8H4Q9P5_9HYPO|nr:hypothetical protein GQ602_007412 [Ophiocordyceps camponoti-floridani]KAF4591781.1 hypothetical protein GQ602_002080 [Ophiocordyceps camponoti-floridani]